MLIVPRKSDRKTSKRGASLNTTSRPSMRAGVSELCITMRMALIICSESSDWAILCEKVNISKSGRRRETHLEQGREESSESKLDECHTHELDPIPRERMVLSTCDDSRDDQDLVQDNRRACRLVSVEEEEQYVEDEETIVVGDGSDG